MTGTFHCWRGLAWIRWDNALMEIYRGDEPNIRHALIAYIDRSCDD